jgi:hypothetical protein
MLVIRLEILDNLNLFGMSSVYIPLASIMSITCGRLGDLQHSSYSQHSDRTDVIAPQAKHLLGSHAKHHHHSRKDQLDAQLEEKEHLPRSARWLEPHRASVY